MNDANKIIQVFVNNRPVYILKGMTVRHALISADMFKEIGLSKVYDEWGNEIGLDGELSEGMKLYIL